MATGQTTAHARADNATRAGVWSRRPRARRTRQRASRWRQRAATSTAAAAATTAAPGATGTKRSACRIENADPEASFDEGFTIDALSMDRETFAAAVPPERRLVVTVATGGTRVAFDVVDVYRWLRANPDGGICGPFGQVPIDQQQRDEILGRAERLLPKRQRVAQEAHFDYAWHDNGADLHYHEPPSGPYLRERVAVGDHEGVLYCLSALAPGDVHSAEEARALLVSAANASLTTIFERLVAHEHVGGLLGVAGLASLVGEIGHMRTPRLDLLVPACRALARTAAAVHDTAVAAHRLNPTPRESASGSSANDNDNNGDSGGDRDLTLTATPRGRRAGNGRDSNNNNNDRVVWRDEDEDASADPLDDTRHDHQYARAPEDIVARTARRIYRSLCLRVVQEDTDDDSSSSNDDDKDSGSSDDDDDEVRGGRRRTVTPPDAGRVPNPYCSAAVRAVYEATRVEPDLTCLATAVDVGARDLFDYMLGVATSMAPVLAVVLARHAIATGCVRSLRLVMHHRAHTLDAADLEAIAEAAAAVAPPTGDLLAAVVAVWRRRAPERPIRAPPACPRRMRFED
ncbi:hypothetical protein psal_cds_151 [Pandoravirus salinus]|uniref:Uncharacterized protein n=1 Tax=Pandoravirus salinus TaxID=1349410 RepID=S4VTI3_9VIRU|nr:hypothetical protein psal_cds_151 [Pandoravirus salinus]AGO83623.1 hypothetical protein psal_cds_151 [Pandoravirus salinus]